jgi:hypothetical protein
VKGRTILESSRLNGVDRRDVRVIERREHARFAVEAGQTLGVVGDRLGQHLDGHFTAEFGVLGAIHLPHAALAELGGDPKMGEGGSNQDRSILTHWRSRDFTGRNLPEARKDRSRA